MTVTSGIFRKSLYWSSHIVSNAPMLAMDGVRLAAIRRISRNDSPSQYLVGTHHKALTVYIGRVFQVFSRIGKLSLSRGTGSDLDYGCDILFDHHSAFDFERVERPWTGLHIIRDPRDILVSSTKYHLHSAEEWLHLPYKGLGKRTYQQYINSLGSFAEQMMFELEEATGVTINDMLNWDYTRQQMSEARYEDLVGDGSLENFRKLIAGWPLTGLEQKVLGELFAYFSIGRPGSRGNKHVRDPKSAQWRTHFTPEIEAAFKSRFPGAVEKLGYSW